MDFDSPQHDSGDSPVDDTTTDPYGADPAPLDATYDSYDTDGDGVMDTLDGHLDDGSTFEVLDYQEDGHGDLVWVDTDGDGNPDLIVTPNGDGSFNVKWDVNPDGSWDSYATLTADEMQAQYPELHELLTTVDVDPSHVYVPDYPDVEDGQIVGDPFEYSHDWFFQSFDGSCAPASVAQIYAEYTGQDVTDLEFIQMANDLQCWANGSGDGHPGMYPEGAVELLNNAGIPAEVTYGSMDSLGQALSDGYGVMVAIDSDAIWTDQGDGVSDHMVTVAAIDYDAGIVYLSDTGTPDGNMEQVPLATFEEAWEASSCTMIECDETVQDYQAEHGITPDQPTEPDTTQPDTTQPEDTLPDTTQPDEEPTPGTPIEVDPTVTEVTQAPWLLLLINSSSLHQ